MSALTTRQQARARIRATVEMMLDQIIPEDESIPLRGRKFVEWEHQADEFDQAVTTTILEERAALEQSARMEAGQLGCCPHCGSDRLYLQQAEPRNKEVRTPHGVVVVGWQSVRCRACDKSFSPSGA